MFEIEITSDIDVAVKDAQRLERELPYIMSRAMNQALFPTREHLVTVTYPAAFTVRNKAFGRRVIQVLKKSHKTDLEAIIGDGLVAKDGGRPYLEVHSLGGMKPHRGATIAIPRHPGEVRGASGRVLASKKPRRITGRKDTFLVKRGGQKLFIARRNKLDGKLDKIYIFKANARFFKRFRFYEDAARVFGREFEPAFDQFLNQVLRPTKFTML